MIDPRTPDYTNTPASHRRPGLAYILRNEDIARESGATKPAAATVVTPFFNTGPVFRETAASIFNQSLQNFEWVIIDDGSTDPDALAILDEYRSIDPRVRVVSHDMNKGLSAARNTGFREARTPFVILVDSDDLIEPTTLEKCVWYLHTHPEASWVKGYTVGFGAQEYLWTRGFHERAEFLNENLATATTMIRTSAWELAARDVVGEGSGGDGGGGGGGFDESIRGGMEDWEFWVRCASLGLWGATIPEYLDWYRRRAAQAIGAGPWDNLSSQDRVAAFRESLRTKYRSLYSAGRETFPHATPEWHMPFEPVRSDVPVTNPVDLLNPAAGTGDANGRRLLLIAPWLTLGGADKFNLAMTRELVERGWSVTIATTVPGDNSWQPEFTKHTPDVFVMPHFLRMPDFPVFLRYLIGSRCPDVVMVSNSELGYHLLPYLRAHHPRPTYVDLCHMEEPWWKNGGYPRYAIGCQPSLDANIVSSEHLRQWMVQRGALAERVEVCYVSDTRGMMRDDEARARVRREQGLSDDHVVILYAGRLVQQKQPRVFAEAMRLLADQRDTAAPWTCLVAGDGPDMGWLRQFVHDNRLGERVRLLGAIPQERMRDYFSASDIFFLPSQWEGIALSVFEAMAMGLVVVGADVGGQRELVTPECGVLLPRASEEQEAAAFSEHLAGLLREPRRVRDAGENGRRRIEAGFTPERMAVRLEAIFDIAARRHRDTPREVATTEFGAEIASRGVEYIRAFSLAETLWNERDHLRHERDSLRSISTSYPNGHLPIHIDPSSEARRIIQSNLRYRAADKVSQALKSIGVHDALKAVTVRAVRLTKRTK